MATVSLIDLKLQQQGFCYIFWRDATNEKQAHTATLHTFCDSELRSTHQSCFLTDPVKTDVQVLSTRFRCIWPGSVFRIKLIEAISFSANGTINFDKQEGIWNGAVLAYRGTNGQFGWRGWGESQNVTGQPVSGQRFELDTPLRKVLTFRNSASYI
jgi:hypothetical protein